MYKTITIRISKDELHQLDLLREHHHQMFKVPINQSQLIRNLIHENFNELDVQDDIDEKGELYTEKEQAHKRDMTILDRLRGRKFQS
jgi:hypothetical protein